MKAYYENRTYASQIPVNASIAHNLDFVAHWHTDIEIVYVSEGRIGVGINSEYKVLEKGDMAICCCNDIHYYHSGEDMTSKIIILIFKPDILTGFKYWPDKLILGSYFMDRSFQADQKTDDKVISQLEAIFNKIIDEINQEKSLYDVSSAISIVELCMMLFRCFPSYLEKSRTQHGNLPVSADIKPMQKALTYIEDNYTMDIPLARIANEVNLSCFYFSRLFKRTTGMGFNVYLTRFRVDKAQALIKSSTKTILEIAYETGFSSIRTFNRTFKALKGCPPGSLRH